MDFLRILVFPAIAVASIFSADAGAEADVDWRLWKAGFGRADVTPDRSVPVLRIDDREGNPRGVVFGCACHNTTLSHKNYRISGDYAGCGGDANPYPRGGDDEWTHVRGHGRTLGSEVCRVMEAELQSVAGPLGVARGLASLPFQSELPREELEKMAAGDQKSPADNAKAPLRKLDAGEALPARQEMPLSVWQFGDDLTLAALSGEVVADYVRLAAVAGRKTGP